MSLSADKVDSSMTRGGPVTQEGKEVVKWNATRHGIRSPAPVVPNLEKREDWESHLEGILENLSPVGHLEITLAERIAVLSWRLHRVTRYETEAISLSQQKIDEDIHDRNRLLLSFRGKSPYATTTFTGCPDTKMSTTRTRSIGERAHIYPIVPNG